MSKQEKLRIQAIINKKEGQAYRRAVTDIFCGFGIVAFYVSLFVYGILR